MKEKDIEKSIISYLEWVGAIVEALQSWSVMIKKGAYTNRMNLQKKGAPDIFCFYQGQFIGIEVKKNAEEANKWLKLRDRYNNWETLPKSYHRELDQIQYKDNILKNKWHFILTYELSEVKEFINQLNKND